MTEKMCVPLPKTDRILNLRYKNENNDNINKNIFESDMRCACKFIDKMFCP